MTRIPRRSTVSASTRRLSPLRASLGAAIAAAAVLGSIAAMPAASAAPSTSPTSLPGFEIGTIPFDSELAAAVRMLKDAGVDKIALEAAQKIIGSTGQVTPEMLIERLDALSSTPEPVAAQASAPAATTPQPATPAATTPEPAATTPAAAPAATPVAKPVANPVAATDPLALLRSAGIQTFTPSVAPFCTDPTQDNPLGLVTAGAGAVAGPWPMKEEPLSVLEKFIPGYTAPKFNMVADGETVYAFVPAPSATAPGGTTSVAPSTAPAAGEDMKVAWLNTTTLEGGFADLKPLTDNAPALKFLPVLSDVRLVPVKTGNGTVLSAVYGSAEHNGRSCFFLPAIGVVDA